MERLRDTRNLPISINTKQPYRRCPKCKAITEVRARGYGGFILFYRCKKCRKSWINNERE